MNHNLFVCQQEQKLVLTLNNCVYHLSIERVFLYFFCKLNQQLKDRLRIHMVVLLNSMVLDLYEYDRMHHSESRGMGNNSHQNHQN